MRKQNLSPAKKRLLCALIGSSLFWQIPAYAAEPVQEQTEQTTQETAADDDAQPKFALEGIEVTANRDKALPPAYAGGQVARGARVGLLGNKDFMDTPFQITAYTAQFIEERQASILSDLLVSDPGVRVNSSLGTFENFQIRGLSVNARDISLNGLPSMAPSGRAALEFIERVEVHKGPNALLNGMGVGGSLGGAVSLTTKQATDEPITRFTAKLESDARLGGHLDFGQRFGDNKEFGIRFNGAYSDGDTSVDRQSANHKLAALNLDYRRDRWRLALDGYTIKDKVNGLAPDFYFNSPSIPAAPKASTNYFPDAYIEEESEGLMFRTEYDLNHGTLYAGIGTAHTDRSLYDSYFYVDDTLGNSTMTNYKGKMAYDKKTYVLGYNSVYQTGGLKHQLALQFSNLQEEIRVRWVTDANRYATNIYQPSSLIFADLASPGSPRKRSETRLSSLALADTLSFAGDKVQFTAGLRRQIVHTKSFNATTGAQTSEYDESAVTPALALVVKPWQAPVSLYANYIEGLQAGSTVSDTAASNYGQVFPPYKTKQYEAGVKWDAGAFAHTFSAYRIFQPSLIKETSNNIITYTDQGQQRSSGLEWNFFGQLNDNTRLLGGAAFNRAVQTKATDTALIGKTVTGAPKWTTSLGVEWDTPWQPNLTLSLRTIYTGRQYDDSLNTRQYPSWVRYDLGARYKTSLGKTPVTINAAVENLFNKNYWSGYYTLGQPRTVKLSVTMDF